MVKRLISGIVAIILLLGLVSFAFAEEEVKDIKYKEFNIYRSQVFYEQDYIVKLQNVEVLQGSENLKYIFKVAGKELKVGEKVKLQNFNYQAKLINGNKVGTKKGNLNINVLNKIDLEVKFMGITTKYRFYIRVDGVDSERIDKDKYEWKKVENSTLKWKETLKYGKKIIKEDINLGETKQTSLETVYGIGIVDINKILNFTPNTKLSIGENKLSTNVFKIGNRPKLRWRCEFIVNLSIPSTSPETTITSSITPGITPSGTQSPVPGTEDDTLPKTGESNPFFYAAIGVLLIMVGVVLFIKKNKIQRQQC